MGSEEMIALDQTRQRSAGRSAMAGGVAAGARIVHTASLAVRRYDGWLSVSILTEKGDCDRGYRYPVRISIGTLANAGDSIFTVSGKVGGSGAVTVMVTAGGRGAT